jgi:hypothetical protein
MRMTWVVLSAARRRRGDGGSVLALVPAAFLVLLILAAIAVDSAAMFLGQRQLVSALSAAANDAAGAAISRSSFYASGVVTVDPVLAASVVCQSVAAQGDGGLHDVIVSIAVDGPVIGVRGTAMVNEVFGRLLPGLHQHQVSAVATAMATPGPAPSPPPPAAYHAIRC